MVIPKLSVVMQKVKRENRSNFLRCLFERVAAKGRKCKELQPKGTEETSGSLVFEIQTTELFEELKRTGSTRDGSKGGMKVGRGLPSREGRG